MKLMSFIYASGIASCLFFCCATTHAQETFNGDLQQFEGRIQKALSNFYAMSLDCAMDQEYQDELIDEIIDSYLMDDGIYSPDLTTAPNKAALFSYRNYILSIWNTFKQYNGKIHELVIQPQNMRILSAMWTADKIGLKLVVSYQIKASLNDNTLFSGWSQAVISFPILGKQSDYKFKQIGLPVAPGNDSGNLRTSTGGRNIEQESLMAETASLADMALLDKDYKQALQYYEKYLGSIKFNDYRRVYNAAYATLNTGNYKKAAEYFDRCCDANYDLNKSIVGSASAYRNLGDQSHFLERVEAGMNLLSYDDTVFVKLEEMLFTYCMREGEIAFIYEDIERGKYLINKIITLSVNHMYRGLALCHLAGLSYNYYSAKIKVVNKGTSGWEQELEEQK